jgi:ribose-phosphate pyrophosphokinase
MITITTRDLDTFTITPTVFPDGTIQVWKLPESVINSQTVNVTWEYRNDSEFFALAQLKTLLDEHGSHASLSIYYLPYARQDKDIANDATFGLHTFAKLLNSLNFYAVYILDPHSNIALDLIKNSLGLFPGGDIEGITDSMKIDYVCYPDSGAREKYSKIYDHPSIYANKLRDPLTGDILELELIGLDEPGKRVLIVDDICDGGATFVRLAKALRDKGASYVGLYVSYALMTKGDELLYNAGIENIYEAVNLRRNRNDE